MDNKRQRSSNFTPEEKRLIIQLVAKYGYVIENKKTDAVNWKEKEATWKNVADDFNARSPSGVYRSSDSLKKFYQNQKKIMRKDMAEERQQILKTGGGSPPRKQQKTDTQELLLSIMNEKTVSGLHNEFDDDHILVEIVDQNNKENKECEDEIHNEEIAEGTLDWGNFKTAYLQTPLHENLKSKISNANTTNNSNWTNRRRPVIKSVSTSQITEDYRELAKIKKELAQVQLDIAKSQLISNEEESRQRNRKIEKEIENLEIENKIKKTQLLLLQKQL